MHTPNLEKPTPLLNAQQIARAVDAMNEYLSAPPGPGGKTPVEEEGELDQKRVALIESELKPLVSNFLAGKVELAEFKSEVDGINKRNGYWGFKGIKGQMFFNLVVNTADNSDECDQELKSVLAVPQNEQ
jgi:hypothetical protein